MEDIGQLLKEARQKLGKTHEAVHEETKISVQHIKYLEENNFSFLPETYVKSYLKNYATALGLDGDDLVSKYTENRIQAERRRAEQTKEAEVLPQPSASRKRIFEWIISVGFFILLVCLILVYVEYRSQVQVSAKEFFVHASPPGEEKTELAEIDLITPTPDEPESHTFELEITAIENVWVQLTIDGKLISEVTLSPTQKFKWRAENRIEVVMGQIEASGEVPKSDGTKHQGDRTGSVRFSFTKDGQTKND